MAVSLGLDLFKLGIEVISHVGYEVQRHQLQLTYAHIIATHVEVFVVTEDQIPRSNALYCTLGLGHLHAPVQGFVNSGYLGKCLHGLLVLRSACCRFKEDCIAQYGRHHNTGNISWYLLLEDIPIQDVENSTCAAIGHGTEKDRTRSCNISNLVVIDNCQQLSLVPVVRGLLCIAVIHQHILLASHVCAEFRDINTKFIKHQFCLRIEVPLPTGYCINSNHLL